MTRRQRSVAKLLKEALSDVLRFDVKDPRVRMVTLTSAEPSPDLRHARVRVSVLAASEEEAADVFRGLESAAGFIKRALGERVELKYLPDLVFIRDHGPEHAERIARILHELDEERRVRGDAAPADEAREADRDDDESDDADEEGEDGDDESA